MIIAFHPAGGATRCHSGANSTSLRQPTNALLLTFSPRATWRAATALCDKWLIMSGIQRAVGRATQRSTCQTALREAQAPDTQQLPRLQGSHKSDHAPIRQLTLAAMAAAFAVLGASSAMR